MKKLSLYVFLGLLVVGCVTVETTWNKKNEELINQFNVAEYGVNC